VRALFCNTIAVEPMKRHVWRNGFKFMRFFFVIFGVVVAAVAGDSSSTGTRRTLWMTMIRRRDGRNMR